MISSEAKKLYIKTFGCQMNEHDSEILAGLMRQEGYVLTQNSREADVVVINTCSIRELSHQKALSSLGSLNQASLGQASPRSKGPVIAVTGCVASHEGKRLMKRFPFVDFVLGPDHIQKLPELVRNDTPHVGVQNFEPLQNSFHDLSDYEFPTVVNQETRAKASVTIMKGCNNVCSFCIVPAVRGPEVYRPADEIIHEIQLLAKQGTREVMLLGQNVNSYGQGVGSDFVSLLERIETETCIERIRFTSPHPKDLSGRLMAHYGVSRRLCPHIHLPVQSGSDRILKRMRRSYTREGVLRKIDGLRKARPDIAITTDIIVGFPGETDEDFQATLDLMRGVDFDFSYSFCFSPRPGTEAAAWPDDVPREAKKDRLTRLQALQEEIALRKNRGLVGSLQEILVEGKTDREGQLTGKTPYHKIVNFDGDPSWVGDTIKVEVTEVSPYSLKGVLCSSR